MTLVVDASVVVAALVDGGPDGTWAESLFVAGHLAAPHLMPVEATNILRRAVTAGDITADQGAMAHAEVVNLPVELFPYEPFSERVWALRDNLTAHDAWYVALAETLRADLATLDARLTRAPGPTCKFLTPPA